MDMSRDILTHLYLGDRVVNRHRENAGSDHVSFGHDVLGKRCKIDDEDTPGKRCKIVADVWYGDESVFVGNKEKINFHIRNFKRLDDKCIVTETATACGHPWCLKIYPRGRVETSNSYISGRRVETSNSYISVYLVYDGSNDETRPIVTNAFIEPTLYFLPGRKKSTTFVSHNIIEKFPFNSSLSGRRSGFDDYADRDFILRNFCDEDGTLSFGVEIEVAVKKTKIWFPKLSTSNRAMINMFLDTPYNVTFVVGDCEEKCYAHRCVIKQKSSNLYNLIQTCDETSIDDCNLEVPLPGIDPSVFKAVLVFMYTGEAPNFETGNDADKETAVSMLVVANKIGFTVLKLYMESVLIQKFLLPSTASRFLVLADGMSCALLKEASLTTHRDYPTQSINSNDGDWNIIAGNEQLSMELYMNAISERKEYFSVSKYGDGSIEDSDKFDVASLLERLEKYGEDLDGTRKMLLERWKVKKNALYNKFSGKNNRGGSISI